MTIEEYLVDVKRVYYQLSVATTGKQLLVVGNSLRLTDIHDSKGRLSAIRFAVRLQRCVLSIPPATRIDKLGTDHAIVNYGDARLVIWPVEEANDDIQRNSASDPGA